MRFHACSDQAALAFHLIFLLTIVDGLCCFCHDLSQNSTLSYWRLRAAWSKCAISNIGMNECLYLSLFLCLYVPPSLCVSLSFSLQSLIRTQTNSPCVLGTVRTRVKAANFRRAPPPASPSSPCNEDGYGDPFGQGCLKPLSACIILTPQIHVWYHRLAMELFKILAL